MMSSAASPKVERSQRYGALLNRHHLSGPTPTSVEEVWTTQIPSLEGALCPVRFPLNP